jgi:hypothetical protein
MSIPSTKASKILGSAVTCPICKKTFEETMNNTRINNHIDKCLRSGDFNPSNEHSTTSISNFTLGENNERVENLGYDPTNQPPKSNFGVNQPQKRKAEPEPNSSKKQDKRVKKTLTPDPQAIKLDAFFKKK